jgi:hypothetical protein
MQSELHSHSKVITGDSSAGSQQSLKINLNVENQSYGSVFHK